MTGPLADQQLTEVEQVLDVWDAAPAHRAGYRDVISSQKSGEDGRKLRATTLRALLTEVRRLRGELDDAAGYLAAIHRHANRHDVLGENLGCAGCALLDRIEGPAAEHDPEAADFHHCAMCGERCYWQESPHGGWWAHEVPSGGDHDAVAGAPCRPGADDYCEPPTEAPQNGPAAPADGSRSPVDAQGGEVAQRGAVGRVEALEAERPAADPAAIATALHEYADRLDAVPLDCTALTGPVWYGAGWRGAVNHLRDLADGLMPARSTPGGSEP